MCNSEEVIILQNVIQEFMQSDGNYLTQNRLQREFQHTQKVSSKNSVSAKSRWSKEKDVCERNAPKPKPKPKPKLLEKDITIVISKKGRKALEDDDLTALKPWFAENAPAIDPAALRSKMLDWCDAKGKIYKDYYAALRNWASKHQEEHNAKNQGNAGRIGNPVDGGNNGTGFGGRKSQTQLASEITEQIKRDRRAKWDAAQEQLGSPRPAIRLVEPDLCNVEKIR